MVSHRNCSVVGCGNSGTRIKKWMMQLCPTHQCNQGACNCPPPFIMFTFPTKMRDNERRRRWIKAVNRNGENGKNWEPNDNACVCSNHFSDGRPTDQNPDPTMNLGYGLLCKQTKAKKPPRPRTPIESPAQKKRDRGYRFKFSARCTVGYLSRLCTWSCYPRLF